VRSGSHLLGAGRSDDQQKIARPGVESRIDRSGFRPREVAGAVPEQRSPLKRTFRRAGMSGSTSVLSIRISAIVRAIDRASFGPP
jgi:hypothetical protein